MRKIKLCNPNMSLFLVTVLFFFSFVSGKDRPGECFRNKWYCTYMFLLFNDFLIVFFFSMWSSAFSVLNSMITCITLFSIFEIIFHI